MAGTKVYLQCGDATCKNRCWIAKSRVRGNDTWSSNARASTDPFVLTHYNEESAKERDIEGGSATFGWRWLSFAGQHSANTCAFFYTCTYLSWLSRSLFLSRYYGLAVIIASNANILPALIRSIKRVEWNQNTIIENYNKQKFCQAKTVSMVRLDNKKNGFFLSYNSVELLMIACGEKKKTR